MDWKLNHKQKKKKSEQETEGTRFKYEKEILDWNIRKCKNRIQP